MRNTRNRNPPGQKSVQFDLDIVSEVCWDRIEIQHVSLRNKIYKRTTSRKHWYLLLKYIVVEDFLTVEFSFNILNIDRIGRIKKNDI